MSLQSLNLYFGSQFVRKLKLFEALYSLCCHANSKWRSNENECTICYSNIKVNIDNDNNSTVYKPNNTT